MTPGYTASRDCAREQCPGTALFDTACQDYVCSRCGHHHKGACAKCDYDPARQFEFTEDPEENMDGA